MIYSITYHLHWNYMKRISISNFTYSEGQVTFWIGQVTFNQESSPGQVTDFFLWALGVLTKIRLAKKIIHVQNKMNSKLKCMGKREGYTKYKV